MQPPKPRTIAIVAVSGVTLGLFGFFRVRGGEPQDTSTLVPDSVAVADSVARADSIARADSVSRADSLANLAGADSTTQDSTKPPVKYLSGEDPDFAAKMGWPVKGPAALPGAILPNKRILAYYGNPLSKRMGVLGEYPAPEMLRRFDAEIARWNAADPEHPVVPALHLIAVVANGDPGPSGKYRTIMRDTLVEQVYKLAKSKNGIMFVDIQVGHSDIRELVPKFEKFLTRPDVHLAVDPEFMMKSGHKPGAKIGTIDASDINYVTQYLATVVRKHNLPPKVLVVHRFTRGMLTNSKAIQLRPEVQIVIDMDGWGAPWLKRDSYKDYVVREPVQYTGFKLFYHNDTKKGDPIMSAKDVLRLHPKPLYIQYQ